MRGNTSSSAVCQKCQNRNVSYFDRTVRFLISQCGHCFCGTCINRIFTGRSSVPCPVCNKIITKAGLSTKTKSQMDCDRIFKIRQSILASYNKTETDFETLRAFNDYLETREEIVHKLAFHVDEDATKREVERYRRKHRDEIDLNSSKKAQGERQATELEKKKREESNRIEKESLLSKKQHRRERRSRHRSKINKLLGIVESYAEEIAPLPIVNESVTQSTVQSTGGADVASGALLGLNSQNTNQPFHGAMRTAQPVPLMHSFRSRRNRNAWTGEETSRARKKRQHAKAAGGWNARDVQRRAWGDVMAGIFLDE